MIIKNEEMCVWPGYEKEQAVLKKYIRLLTKPELLAEAGISMPKGLLVYGPQGVGKTDLIVSSVPDGVSCVLINLLAGQDYDEIIKSITKGFEEAKSKAPCVVVIQHLDYFRDSSYISEAVLQNIGELRPSDGVLVFGVYDGKKESGKFCSFDGLDQKLFVPYPNQSMRTLFLRKILQNVPLEKQMNTENVARMYDKETFSYIQQSVNRIVLNAVLDGRSSVTERDFFLDQINNDELYPVDDMTPEEVHRVAVHEAGHAVAAWLLYPEAVVGVAVRRHHNQAGLLHVVPEKFVESVAEKEQRIVGLLAARAAERIVLGENLTGSASDIDSAVEQTRILTEENGSYGFAPTCTTVVEDMSKTCAEKAVSALVDMTTDKLNEFSRRADTLLRSNRKLLDAVISALETRRILLRDEICEIAKQVSEICDAA